MPRRVEPDDVFAVAGVHDPFVDDDPYLLALLDLPSAQRRVIGRQVALLCIAIGGLDPLGALELLGQVGALLGEGDCW